MTISTQAKALYDYAAEAETDLSFYEGDIVIILEDQDPRLLLHLLHNIIITYIQLTTCAVAGGRES